MPIKEIFKKVLFWRLITIVFAILGIFLVALKPDYSQQTVKFSLNNLLEMWANFDGTHYLNLAKYHYGSAYTRMDFAFFPVFPWVIRTFNIFGSYIVSALFITNLCFALALYFLYKLIIIDFKPKIAKLAILSALVFPTSFFFGAVYNESIFLLEVVLVFYLSRKRHFFLAGVIAAIASATRVTGIFLWPSIIYEYYLLNGQSIRKCLRPEIIWLGLPPLGILSFMKFQLEKTGDPLFFIHIQANFAQRSTEKLILLYQVFYRYFKMLIFVDHTDPLFFTVFIEFLSAAILVLVLIFFFKKIRFSYWMFTFLSFILPSLTGTFSSLPRYIIVLFPVYICMGIFLNKINPISQKIFIAFSILLSLFAISLFTRGYFIG